MDVLVQSGQLRQGLGDVFRMRLHVVHGTEALKRAQHPQVREVVVAAGPVEQPKAVADRERVEVKRCLRGLGLRAPGFTRPVHLPRNDTGRPARRSGPGWSRSSSRDAWR